MNERHRICIVGLGYVGLPLAYAFARGGHDVSGYDINAARIDALNRGIDATGEVSDAELRGVTIRFSADPAIIGDATVIILAIPTPIDDQNKPDLALLQSATRTVGEHMAKGAIVVYESTVYPGTTEEICGPILEQASGMKSGVDFTLGYSPERINPGDKEHTVDKIVKIVAGQDDRTTDELCTLYGSIVKAGIHRAASIKIAEMAKAIENAQRDLNIAYINEIAVLCGAIGIPTKDVLDAAGTKWNFLKFSPGLVGGHCISVDPYYLVEKARQLGIHTNVIAAGRSINDQMGRFVAHQIHEALGKKPARILVLGLTFKENIPDMRNSKSEDVVRALAEHGHDVEVHDPHMDIERLKRKGMVHGSPEMGPYDAVALLVPHREYLERGAEIILGAAGNGGLIYDLKSILNKTSVIAMGKRYLAL